MRRGRRILAEEGDANAGSNFAIDVGADMAADVFGVSSGGNGAKVQPARKKGRAQRKGQAKGKAKGEAKGEAKGKAKSEDKPSV